MIYPRLATLLLTALTTLALVGCTPEDEVGLGETCEQDSQCPSGAVCAAVDGEVEPQCQVPDTGDAGTDASTDTGDDVTEDTSDTTSDTRETQDTQDTEETQVGDTSDTADSADSEDTAVDDISEDAADTEADTTDDAGCTNVSSAACASHWLFITSTKFTGNLGGASGADQSCADAASDAGLSRSGWKAVIADEATGVRDRISINGEVYLTDGVRFAADSNAFFLNPEAKPLVDEFGDTVTESARRFYGAWTGTDSEAPGTDQCFAAGSDTPWTTESSAIDGHFGFTDVAGNKAWLQNGASRSCDTELRLYCISDQ